MKTFFVKKNILLSLMMVGLAGQIYGAASSATEDYTQLVQSHQKRIPGFVNRDLSIPNDVIFHNNTASPLELLFNNNENSQRVDVPQGGTAPLGSGKTLKQLIGVLPKSVTSTWRWTPAIVATTLGSIAYGSEFQPIDLGSKFSLVYHDERTPASTATVHFNRNLSGLSFDYEVEYNLKPENRAAFIQKLKNNPQKIYIKNNSNFDMYVIFNKNQKIPLKKERDVLLYGIDDPTIVLQTVSYFGADSPTATIGQAIYAPIQKDIAGLFYKEAFSGLRPFFDQINLLPEEQEFSIIIPEDNSWDVYITKKN